MLLRRENILGFRLLANNSKIPTTAVGWIFFPLPTKPEEIPELTMNRNNEWVSTPSARNSLDFLARLMSLEGQSDTEIHFYKTLGVEDKPSQDTDNEGRNIPATHKISDLWRRRRHTFSLALSHYFLLIYNIILLLVLYERCSDAVSDDNPVKPPKKSCGRITLRNPINILILSILIPRFLFFFHFVEWSPGNTWHQRSRGNVILLFFVVFLRSVYALPWYILDLVMLISNLHQHNCGEKKIPECRVILKTRPGTITYKNKCNQHNLQQSPNFIHLVARSEFGWTSFYSAPKNTTRSTVTNCHQLRKCSINDVSPGSEAEMSSQRRMWFLNPDGSLCRTFLPYVTRLFTRY